MLYTALRLPTSATVTVRRTGRRPKWELHKPRVGCNLLGTQAEDRVSVVGLGVRVQGRLSQGFTLEAFKAALMLVNVTFLV